MQQSFVLNDLSVDHIAQKVMEFCDSQQVATKDALRYRISAEEILNRWIAENRGETVVFKTGRRVGRPYIILEMKGEPSNPFDNEDSDSFFLSTIRADMGYVPQYSYRKKKNTVFFELNRKKMNQLLKLLITIVLGLIAGFVLKLTLSGDITARLLTNVINPLYSALFRLLGYISGPLIFLSVIWGIYGIGDASTLGKIGKRLILSFLSVIFGIVICFMFSFPLFNLKFLQGSANESSFGTIFEMLLDIIPANIIAPFSDGNTLQIIFTAVIFGIAMLFLGKRVQTVADMVDQINCIVQFMMDLISRMIPGFIFLIVVRLILNDTFSMISSIWVLALEFIAAALIICTLMTAFTSIHCQVSPLRLVKKSIATFLIAITTASSAACFASNAETCEHKLGIDQSLSSFGIPLGMVMFKSSTAVYYLLISFFFAGQFSVECSASWLITAAFMAALLAVATPPIPGGGVVAYTILFSRLGIPDDALAIVLSVDILFDFVRTAANMYNLPLMLSNVALRMGLLNCDVMREETSQMI